VTANRKPKTPRSHPSALVTATDSRRGYRKRSPIFFGFGGILVLILSLFLFLFLASKPVPIATHSSAYADSASCGTCHAGIAKAYVQTGMGRSFSIPSSTLEMGDFSEENTYHHAASGSDYSMLRSADGWYELRQDAVAPSETEQKRIDYVIGSGNHARTFLHRTQDGRLIELPVSWYAEKGGYWAMSPGYDRKDSFDFRRAIGQDCMFCHDGFSNRAQESPVSSPWSAFKGKPAEGIDCQRCHGPGAAHVKAAQTPGLSLEAVRASIVNPAKLDRDRQLDTCMQCHLETTSLGLPNSIPHYDQVAYSYRPGQTLGASISYFDHEPGSGFDDRFEVAHQAYRLAKSQCFLKSQMTCTTCHDPHVALRGSNATKHFEEVCTSCHQSVHPALLARTSSTCMDCHMWKRRTEDAVHVVMTDHFIQRNKPSRELLASLPEIIPDYRKPVISYRPAAGLKDVNGSSEGEKLYLAAAQVEQDSNLLAGMPQLQAAVDRLSPKEPDFYYVLGSAYHRAGNQDAALRALDQALARQPRFQPALREKTAVLEQMNRLPQAAEAGEFAVAADPSDTTAYGNLASVYLKQSRDADARRVLLQALAIDPEMPEASNMLGVANLHLADSTAAESAFRQALRAEPGFAEARTNLGTLLASRGEITEATTQLLRALSDDPSDADAYHSYAVVLAMSGKGNEARTAMQQALKLQPKSIRYRIDLATFEAANGHMDSANRELRRVLQLDPGNADAAALMRQFKER
jgi:predicted CXXCH cytochrome family protein